MNQNGHYVLICCSGFPAIVCELRFSKGWAPVLSSQAIFLSVCPNTPPEIPAARPVDRCKNSQVIKDGEASDFCKFFWSL